MTTQSLKGKVFVGMSGGVDSSVSAALLQKEGYEVVGVFIKVWQADFLPCTWREERRDAMRVAAHLGLPLITLDLEKEYKEEVVDYMIREYGEGRVPNPDVMCNKHVKFGAFLDFAKKNGADYVATGHYARVEYGGEHSLHKLLMGVDKEKDQSYFLWTLSGEQLAHTLFPVGHLEKKEVRRFAKEFGLPNAEKKDSQGLCFMGAVDMAEFLKHYLKTKEGSVLNVAGNVLGTHDGAMLYTMGQRHGFRTTKQHADEPPLFVVGKNIAQNTITVAPRVDASVKENSAVLMVKEVSDTLQTTLSEHAPLQCCARIRYRGSLYKATLTLADVGCISVSLETADEYVALGQSIVFYDGEEVLGGGVIT